MKKKSYQGVEWSREIEGLFESVIEHNVVGVNVGTVKEISKDHIWWVSNTKSRYILS